MMIAGMPPAGGQTGGGDDLGQVLARISGQISDVSAQLAEIREQEIREIREQEIPALEETGRENRKLINVLIAAAVVFAFVIVAVVAGFAYWNSRQDAAQASRNAAAARAADADARGNCMAANKTRARDLVIQEQEIPGLNKTPAEKALLLREVRVKDAQRNCP